MNSTDLVEVKLNLFSKADTILSSFHIQYHCYCKQMTDIKTAFNCVALICLDFHITGG